MKVKELDFLLTFRVKAHPEAGLDAIDGHRDGPAVILTLVGEFPRETQHGSRLQLVVVHVEDDDIVGA